MERLLTMQCHAQPFIFCRLLLLAPSSTCSSFAIKANTPLSLRRSKLKVTPRTHCFQSISELEPPPFDIAVLEDYTRKVPSELLLVHAMVDDEEDEVLVYRGHSSSLMRATSSDLEDVLLPPNATIYGIDRMKGPYNPNTPFVIEEGLSWSNFLKLQSSRAS